MYEWLKFWYGMGVSKEQCRKAVALGKINADQYEQITKEKYQ